MPFPPPRMSRAVAVLLSATLLCAPLAAPAQATGTETPDPEHSQNLLERFGDLNGLPANKRVDLARDAASELGLEHLDAQLGQGARRIAENGDPTVPTVAELEVLGQQVAQATQQSPLSAPGNAASFDELRTWRPPGVLGIDVSRHQGQVDWSYAKNKGVRFSYAKATQSWPDGLYKDPNFTQNYTGAAAAGLLRGAYHFALPAHSSGAAQAKEFLANGGGWSADGKTLPPLLDIEWNPYSATSYPQGRGDVCYGMTPAELVAWIKDFGSTIKSATGRLPMIYTAQSWWDQCTGDSTAFASWPLHVSLYPTAAVPKNPRELPEGWKSFNMWQYTSNSDLIGSNRYVDANVWNGDLTSLKDFARNTRSTPYRMVTDYLGNADVWPTRLEPVRLYGKTLYDTPVEISRRMFPSGAKTVVIASGERFEDALVGSPLATSHQAPLLLTKKHSVPAGLATELKRLNPKQIIVLGGPLTIADSTISTLKNYGSVTRFWGNTLYDTSSKIAARWSSSKSVFVATGERFEDAMSLAAVAAKQKSPMVLTKQKSLPATTAQQLKRLNPSTVYLAGGPLAISQAAEQQIRAAVPGAKVVRYGGRTLYDTSALIATTFWPKGAQRQFIATGARFPDGLTGAVAAAYNGAPMLLTKKNCLPPATAKALTSMQGWTNVMLGGPLVLDETVAYRSDGRLNTCS
ncbi:cell wall-binding repeat-containing protein [Glutamicibacter sp. X7]